MAVLLKLMMSVRLRVALATLGLLAGCATVPPVGMHLDREAVVALNAAAADTPYRLVPGDRVEIKFTYARTLNDEVTIRSDGKISLQLVDEVMAAGMTPEELAQTLTQAYARAMGTEARAAAADEETATVPAAPCPDTAAPCPSAPASMGTPRYLLGIGEKISVKSYYNDALNEDLVIRPDGRISMQLIGEVQAAGVSPEQLAATISQRLKGFVQSPDISVIVREFRRPDLSVIVRQAVGQRVFVGGEVKQPTMLGLPSHLGLLAATMEVGGALETARMDNVILLRQQRGRQPDLYSVNLNGIIRGEIPDIDLQPLDVVYVPKSAVAATAASLRQYIYNLLPSQFMMSMGYQINPAVSVKAE